MATYHKLVRDRIPEILDQKGVPYERHTASDEEYRDALLAKLDEEVAEFREGYPPEEFADLIEVIEALKRLPEYAKVENIRTRKREERGAFDQRIILKGEK